MDPIQKMEVYDAYSYTSNGFNVDRVTESDEAVQAATAMTKSSTYNSIKCEPQHLQPQIHHPVPKHRIIEKRKKSIEVSPTQNERPSTALYQSSDIQQNSISKKRNLNAAPVAIDLTTVNENGDVAGGSVGVGAGASAAAAAIVAAVASENENGDKIINDDYHFLLSLHPFMLELNPIQKLKIRVKIQELVFDELYGNENLV